MKKVTFKKGELYHVDFVSSLEYSFEEKAELIVLFKGTTRNFELPGAAVEANFIFLAFQAKSRLGGLMSFSLYCALQEYFEKGVSKRIVSITEFKKRDLPLWVPWITSLGIKYLRTM